MRTLFFILLCLSACSTQAQKVNQALRHELDSIYERDQYYRELLGAKGAQADSLARVYGTEVRQLDMVLWRYQSAIDSANIIRVRQILAQYGYPGKTLVDSPANEAVFYVLQHSDDIDQYLPVVRAAAEQKELPFRLYAMMLDRSLMYAGKEQEYGTQGHGFEYTGPDGKKAFRLIIWPIRDPATVDERRKKAGFSLTVAANAQRMGIVYTPLTLDEVKRLKQTAPAKASQ